MLANVLASTLVTKLLFNAGSQINAASLIDAGGYDVRVLINAGYQINDGSLINASDADVSEYQLLYH